MKRLIVLLFFVLYAIDGKAHVDCVRDGSEHEAKRSKAYSPPSSRRLEANIDKKTIELASLTRSRPEGETSVSDTISLSLSNPPMLNMPFDKENIPVQLFQNINFSWTPLHMGSINAAFSTEYLFELWEIYNEQVPAQQYVQTAQPLYSTATSSPILIYGPTMPMLIEGKRYAWRVRVQAKKGFDDLELFTNNGYSQVWSFAYAANCPEPSQVLLTSPFSDQIKVQWAYQNTYQQMKISYREAGKSKWYHETTTDPEYYITQLKDNTEYEVKIAGICTGGIETYSQPATIKTLEKGKTQIPNFNCGTPPKKLDLSNKAPLPALNAGETVTAGDFEITITEARGGGGTYSGKGYMRVPYFKLARLAITFQNVQINTSRQLIGGYFQAVYDEANGTIVNTTELVKAFGEFAKGLLELAKGIGDGSASKEQIAEKQKEVESKIKELDEKLKDEKLSASDKETLESQKESLSKTNEVLDEVAKLNPGEDCDESTGMIQDKLWNPYQEEVYWASTNSEEMLKYVYEKLNKNRPVCASKIEKAIEGGKNSGKESNTTAKQPKNYYTSNGECFLFKVPEGYKDGDKINTFNYEVPKGAMVFYQYFSNETPFIINSILHNGKTIYELKNVDGFTINVTKNDNLIKTCQNASIIPKQNKDLSSTTFIINGVSYNVLNDKVYKNEQEKYKKEQENTKDKTIEVKGKYKATAHFDKSSQKWSVKVTLLGKKNSKITTSDTTFKKSIEKLAEEKLKQLGGWNNKTKSVSDNDFYVKEMNGEEWFKEICDLGTNVWENATLPETYWNEDQGSKTSNIRMPALFTGVADGGIEMISDYPQLVKLGYDVATKEEVRTGIWNGVKNITPEKIKILASDAVKEKWKKYNSPKQYIQAHEAGYDGVSVIKMLVGGSLIIGIKDVGEKFSKKTFANISELVADIVAKRKNIRKVLDIAEGKAYALKYFNQVVKNGNFEEWWAKAKKYDVNDDLNFEVHHVIPVGVLEKNQKLQELMFWAEQNGKKFDFNSIDNGLPLQKKKAAIDLNGHTNHPKYDEAITEKLLKITESKTLDNAEKFDAIKSLIEKTKNKLENEVLLGNKDVNQIIDL